MNIRQRIADAIAPKKSLRKYEGAARANRNKFWNTPGSDADTALRGSLATLRNRSRDLVRNNPYASRGIDALVDDIVGDGIIGTIKHPDPKQQKKLNASWRKWAESKQPDFYGLNTFYGLQRVAMRSILEGGECLVQKHVKRSGFPLEFQLMEGDHLEFTDNRQLDNGNRIAAGIEFNGRGKRIAYHILTEHPGSNGVFNNREKIEIDADDMSHIFRTDRAGQSRGIPALSSAIIRLRNLDEYEDAQLVRQKIAACWAVFIHDIEAGDLDDETEIELLEKVEPGMIEVLPPGKDIKFASPPVIEGYKEFMSVSLHAIASGLGISYEALTQDLTEVNFSSARMGNIRMQKTVKAYRKHVLKPLFLDFVGQKFLQMSFLLGENVTGASFDWTSPRVEMIDPVKETKAAVDAIRGGISTLSQEIKATGRDPDDVLNEWAEDAKKMDELELALECDPRRVNRGGSLQDDPDEEPSNPPADKKKGEQDEGKD